MLSGIWGTEKPALQSAGPADGLRNVMRAKRPDHALLHDIVCQWGASISARTASAACGSKKICEQKSVRARSHAR